MNKNLYKRLFQIIIVLLGISLLSFILVYLSPGDPVEAMLSVDGNIPSQELLNKVREEMGLNKPFYIQYLNWLKSLLSGNMGISYSTKSLVSTKLFQCFVPTMKLTFLSIFFMLIFSFPLGIISAIKAEKWQDYLIRGITFLGVSIPNFWIGLILLSIFGVKLHWVSIAGGKDNFSSLILPALTLAFAMSSKFTRQVRQAILEELNKEYVEGAKMRGIKKNVILLKHVIPNAFIPLITLFGLSFGNLLGGTAVVEIIYNLPGMGNMAVKAINARDYPLIQAYVLWVALIYMLINLAVDISYKYLDPRIREEN